MAVTLTETTMIALDCRLDDAFRVADGPLNPILSEADRNRIGAAADGRVSP
jgi:hypothetical protein